jgi:hypothetical protein
VTVWYSNPLSPHFLHTTPTIPCTMTTSRLYFDPRAILQVCRHIRVQCYETLTTTTCHMLSVFLQGKTLTAYIWNTVCKLHAAQIVTLKCSASSAAVLPVPFIQSTHIKGEEDITQRETAY